VLALGALGSPVFQLLAVFADQVFHVGDLAYGFLGAALGIGALMAAPLIAGPGSGLARSRLVMLGTTVYGAALVLFAIAPWYGLAIVGLLLCGGAYLAIASTLNTTLQLQVDEVMRGKVIAAYIMCLTLAIPLGTLAQGALADLIGARLTVASAGAVFLAATWWLRVGTGFVRAMDDDRVEPEGDVIPVVAATRAEPATP
jgi:MFS family permease